MKILAIIKKELETYFCSPIAYIVFTSFLVIVGYLFWGIIVTSKIASLGPTLYNAAFVLLLATPILTMRLISEEKKNKTIELLLTSPISPIQIILGKFFGCLIIYLLLISFTLQYPSLIAHYCPQFDWGPVICGYIGVILLGGAFISVGLFASTISENQIVSAILSFGILLLFWMFGLAKDVFDNAFGNMLGNLSLFERYSEFLKGVLDSGNVVFFVVFTIIWLFLAARSLESDRWR